MTDKTDIVRRHVEAVTQMLLGNYTLQPDAMIIAGELTGGDGPIALGQVAQALGKDIVFLAFGNTATGAVRNGICHVQPGCSLYLPHARDRVHASGGGGERHVSCGRQGRPARSSGGR